ncbi:MAG: cellulase family glycosylhydrolase [Bryobacterales bacterium]|nr:cellulase family glycosylhydrolase [Bryobacterales bacterium]
MKILQRLGFATLVASMLAAAQSPALGPLRVSASHPQWFADPSGRAVVLAGSHTWWSLQDNGLIVRGATANPPKPFEYEAYLRFLQRHGHNFIRLWRWETTRWTDRFTGNEVKYCRPHPWRRTGPGNAADGEPKFDVTQLDPAYFERLRGRVKAAGDLGIYVSVMLFEGWEIQFSDAWKGHPFHAANNVNGVEGDLDGSGIALEWNTLQSGPEGRRILQLQEAYVRKVVDAVNDLDNVMYEIANEAHGGSTAWQYHMIRFVKQYEAAKPKQHPVGMTFQHKGGTNAVLNESPADWISPNPGDQKENYRDNPCAGCSPKVVLTDTDHLWGHTGGDSIWVWKSFTRGLNPLLMEEMLPSPVWQDSARLAMGQVVRYGRRVNLAGMKPMAGLSATGYCLAAPGSEYLVFQNNKGEFTVDLAKAAGRYQVEWLDVAHDRVLPGSLVEGGGSRTFTTPFPGPAVLYLKRVE